jgi:hypothetical protein
MPQVSANKATLWHIRFCDATVIVHHRIHSYCPLVIRLHASPSSSPILLLSRTKAEYEAKEEKIIQLQKHLDNQLSMIKDIQTHLADLETNMFHMSQVISSSSFSRNWNFLRLTLQPFMTVDSIPMMQEMARQQTQLAEKHKRNDRYTGVSLRFGNHSWLRVRNVHILD